MSIIEPNSGADAPEIPDGLYTATVKAVKDITLETPDAFGNSEKVEIQLAFKDADGVDRTLEPRVNRKWGEKANLFLIAVACGIDAEPHAFFDTDYLVGRKVNVLVETPEEGKWPRVKSWIRIKGKAAAAPTEAPDSPVSDTVESIGAWWAETRKRNWAREDVLALAEEMFDKQPADMDEAERDLLLEDIKPREKATA